MAERTFVHGGRRLSNKLHNLSKPSRARAAAREALGQGAKSMNKSLKSAVPVGRGKSRRIVGDGIEVPERFLLEDLRKSIGRRKRTYAGNNIVFEAIGPRYEYEASTLGRSYRPSGVAKSVEFGTLKDSPMPFMRPGFENGKAMALRMIQKSLKAAIKKQARKG